MSYLDLENRVSVVTGASSGIGYRTAQRFAEEGARVVAVARSIDPLEDLAKSYPGHILPCAGDLSDDSFIDAIFDKTERELGPCEVLVNNAGAVVVKTITKMTPEEWDEIFAVNVRAVYLASRRAVRSMQDNKGGSIINVASISGVHGSSKFPATTAYAASKGAVISFTEALAAEVKGRGVRVNAVSPGSVDTPMLFAANPMAKPDMTPDEVANVILFLASDLSRPINGQNLHVFSA